MRAAGALALANVAGQLIAVLVAPLLTRLYSPVAFGALAVFGSVLGILSVVAGLRFELAVPLPRSDAAAANVLALSLLCACATTLALSAFLVGADAATIRALGAEPLHAYLWLLPPSVLASAVYTSFCYWALRKKRFDGIARTKLAQGVAAASTQYVGGVSGAGPVGLLLGPTLGSTAGALFLVYAAVRESKRTLRQIRLRRLAWAAQKYVDFARYSTLSGAVNVTGNLLPPVLLSLWFSPTVAGYFFLTERVLRAPLALIGTSIGQVLHTEAAEARRAGTLAALTYTTFARLMRIGAGPLLVFGAIAPDVFRIAFGSEWETAGEYATWMTPWLAAVFVVSPLSIVGTVVERERDGLVAQLLLSVTRIAVLAVAARFLDSTSAGAVYAVSCFLLYGAFAVWLFRVAGVRLSKVGTHVVGYLIVLIPLVAAIRLARSTLGI